MCVIKVSILMVTIYSSVVCCHVQVYVRLRPFFREFLERMSQIYEVNIILPTPKVDLHCIRFES